MPTYEYKCGSCKHVLEKVQKISDNPLVKCPKCGKKKLKRLISKSDFILKGDGWYKDGYGNKPKDT